MNSIRLMRPRMTRRSVSESSAAMDGTWGLLCCAILYNYRMSPRSQSGRVPSRPFLPRWSDMRRRTLAGLLMCALLFQGILSSAHSYVHARAFGPSSSFREFRGGTHGADAPGTAGVPAHNNRNDETNCPICLALLMGGTCVPAQSTGLAPDAVANGLTVPFAASVVASKTRHSPVRPRAPPPIG